jgi:hypothetical protein
MSIFEISDVNLDSVMLFKDDSGNVYWRPSFSDCQKKTISSRIGRIVGDKNRSFYILSNAPFRVENKVEITVPEDEDGRFTWKPVDLFDCCFVGATVKGQFDITVAVPTSTVINGSQTTVLLLKIESSNGTLTYANFDQVLM